MVNDTLGHFLLGPNDTEGNGIYLGDAQELMEFIPDRSVDLIFTDPPYLKRHLHLYNWLSKQAARVLKPSGFLLAYVGVYWKVECLTALTEHMGYFWDFACVNRTGSPLVWRRRIISKYKSIIALRPLGGKGLPRCQVLGVWVGSGEDKKYHAWGQDESTARYYVDCFSKRGDVVLDPFCGGGTTSAMAWILGRRFLSFEIVPDVVKQAREHIRNTQLPLPSRMLEQAELAF